MPICWRYVNTPVNNRCGKRPKVDAGIPGETSPSALPPSAFPPSASDVTSDEEFTRIAIKELIEENTEKPKKPKLADPEFPTDLLSETDFPSEELNLSTDIITTRSGRGGPGRGGPGRGGSQQHPGCVEQRARNGVIDISMRTPFTDLVNEFIQKYFKCEAVAVQLQKWLWEDENTNANIPGSAASYWDEQNAGNISIVFLKAAMKLYKCKVSFKVVNNVFGNTVRVRPPFTCRQWRNLLVHGANPTIIQDLTRDAPTLLRDLNAFTHIEIFRHPCVPNYYRASIPT